MALTDNLVAYWRLYEGGETRADSLGTYHLTDNNTVGQLPGPIYNAASLFSTDTEYLNVASAAPLQHNADFTYTAWVYLDTLVTGGIVTKWGSAPKREMILTYTTATSRFRFIVRNAADSAGFVLEASTLGAPSAATWYFIYWYFDKGTGLGISVNDGTVDTLAETGDANTGTADFVVGAQDEIASSPLNGRLADIGRWSRVLTSGEVTSLYNSGNGLTYPFNGHPVDTYVKQLTSSLA